MTGNVSLAIMRKIDIDKVGYLEEQDVVRASLEDPVSYGLLADLHNFAPDFMDKHRQVINGNSANNGNGSKVASIAQTSVIAKTMSSKFKSSINSDLKSVKT